MTKRTVKPPIVEASLTASSTQSLTDNYGRIVKDSMGERTEEALEDALEDDDEQWVRTVLSSLEKRSHGVRTALEKALLNGEQDQGPLLAPFVFKIFLLQHLAMVGS